MASTIFLYKYPILIRTLCPFSAWAITKPKAPIADYFKLWKRDRTKNQMQTSILKTKQRLVKTQQVVQIQLIWIFLNGIKIVANVFALQPWESKFHAKRIIQLHHLRGLISKTEISDLRSKKVEIWSILLQK